jgi:hypothetical protein
MPPIWRLEVAPRFLENLCAAEILQHAHKYNVQYILRIMPVRCLVCQYRTSVLM